MDAHSLEDEEGMGVHRKIGITGLPRSGKSAVMEKVLDMLMDERKREISMRGGSTETPILGGVRTEPLVENGERMGYKIIDIVSGEEGIIAHKKIDSRLRVLGYGIDTEELNLAKTGCNRKVNCCDSAGEKFVHYKLCPFPGFRRYAGRLMCWGAQLAAPEVKPTDPLHTAESYMGNASEHAAEKDKTNAEIKMKEVIKCKIIQGLIPVG